jgi:hypothetical protein
MTKLWVVLTFGVPLLSRAGLSAARKRGWCHLPLFCVPQSVTACVPRGTGRAGWGLRVEGLGPPAACGEGAKVLSNVGGKKGNPARLAHFSQEKGSAP